MVGLEPGSGLLSLHNQERAPAGRFESAELALHQEYAAEGSPDRFKRYSDSPKVSLPPNEAQGEFVETLLRRRTWREFADGPVSLAELEALLHLTRGIVRTATAPGLGRVHLTTSPSGGARQPLEAYVLAVRVRGLRPGLYHYAAETHQLELLSRGVKDIAKYIPGQWWYESAAALFMLTAVFARTQWRYRTPRAYRNVLLEAGHVMQTFCLTATWLGLAPFCTARFSEAIVESAINVDGITESFIYGGGVGRRPPGTEWAPWPAEHQAGHPLKRRSPRVASRGRPERPTKPR